jgi:hypothetical protein
VGKNVRLLMRYPANRNLRDWWCSFLVSLCTFHDIRIKEEAMPDVKCDYCHEEKDSKDMYFCPKCRMWVCWNCAKHSGMSTGTWCPRCGELLEEQK